MNLGGSFSEMFFLFLLVLVIFGPKKLPEIARQIGKALAEFRRASNEFKSQLDAEMRQIEIEELLKKQKDERQPQILPPPEAGTERAESAPAQGPTAGGKRAGEAEATPGHHA